MQLQMSEHMSYKKLYLLRPQQCRPLVSDSISYINCPTPTVKQSEKLILDTHLGPDFRKILGRT